MMHQLPAWEQNGFSNAKGEPIKYREDWEQLANLIKIHIITIAAGAAHVQCLAAERDGENGKREIGCLRDLGK